MSDRMMNVALWPRRSYFSRHRYVTPQLNVFARYSTGYAGWDDDKWCMDSSSWSRLHSFIRLFTDPDHHPPNINDRTDHSNRRFVCVLCTASQCKHAVKWHRASSSAALFFSQRCLALPRYKISRYYKCKLCGGHRTILN